MKLNINGKTIEVNDEELSKAIEEKKESFDLTSDLVMRTADEEKLFSENIKQSGISVGAEIGRKEVIKGMGIEAEGAHKSDKTSIDAINSFMQTNISTALTDAKIEPNKKVDELTKDLTTLRGTIDGLTTEKNNALSSFDTFKKDLTIKSSISAHIPDNTILPKEQMLKLMDSVKADVNEHGVVFGVGVDGQPIKNTTTLEPLPMKDVVGGFFNENPHLLKASTGGGGGSDSGGSNGKQTLEQFTKEMNDAGKGTGGTEFNATMGERIKAGTLEA